MNVQVCVNCRNVKPVNRTDNRLVTESCGHVKCMDCLLREKSGCIACKERVTIHFEDSIEPEVGLTLNNETIQIEPAMEFNELPKALPVLSLENLSKADNNYNEQKKDNEIIIEELNKKKKPETSHIKIEIDGNGRCYLCTECDRRFHARSQVAYHAYCNGQEKPFQCPECNKSFAAQSHYKYHMRVHRNERTYSCDVCGDSFFQMSKLQRHKLKHTKEKKYACTECNKGFNNLTALRKHGLTHTEERPYGCSECSRRFRDKSNFRKHIAKHAMCGRAAGAGGAGGAGRALERRAHQCPRCPQAFHSRKDMRRHAQVHTDSKPFRCKVCNRRFRRKDNLERHIRNTHPDYVPASAVECDVTALKQLVSANGHSTSQPMNILSDEVYDSNEKSKLEILNPLPPLPQEIIEKHMQTEDTQNNEDTTIDKSYILEANNARQSVIVVKSDRKSSPVTEYVHKIRKAQSNTNQKDGLPPIDRKKIDELKKLNDLDVGVPLAKDLNIYKSILFHGKKESNASNEIHWKRKMQLNIN